VISRAVLSGDACEPHGLTWLLCACGVGPQTLYLLCLSKECIARVLDVLFLEGSNILVSIGLSFFHLHEKELLKLDDLMEVLQFIGQMGSEITDNDALMKVVLKESRCKIGEEDEKRRQIERQVMENAYMKDLQKTQSARTTTHVHVRCFRDWTSACMHASSWCE
jgi:hypothetical protein